MTQGAEALARLNKERIAFSLSPTYLFSNSGPFMEMKFALDSLETAFATKVFPQPGGPYKRTPAGADRPIYLNFSGLTIGSTMVICSSILTLARAPTSPQVVFGTMENPSL
eukprot:CAMPEP_0202979728 /NCGR_PEP_ID=MMETSP1396-20130829/85807_1 /ASSEMBLY_ACC=CAM_ASM_000872 /TAXON_ID= /ORGANISM="Pseudokeronopsis sp., Strain Brazil" /LENGTH=110 /DNA_ID=CAMNT_0049719297 /DNA_START=412 /DNA_END=744 /DNA_ORIENTATION=+